MKTVLTFIVAITLIAPSAVLACDKTKTKDAKKENITAREKAKKPEKDSIDQKGGVLLTGSYIKRDIRRRGEITDGPNVVAVLDSKTIKNSGAADLRQLLVRTGAHH